MTGRSASGVSPAVWLVLFVMPVFFSTNIVIGRAAVSDVAPFTLAFLRWSLAALVLLPFGLKGIRRGLAVFSREWPAFLVLGLCGMLICGGVLYLALQNTTATNGSLIYAAAPVFIILLERMFRGRQTNWREAIGIAVAFTGLVSIVTRGSLAEALALQFNPADILVVVCTICWAVYSVIIKRQRIQEIPTATGFLMIAVTGAVILFPFMVFEVVSTGQFPSGTNAWLSIAGLVIFPSVLAFSCYQYGVKRTGPVITGIFLYLMPVSGILMAVLFLGEQLAWYHGMGAALVLGGVILATFQPSRR